MPAQSKVDLYREHASEYTATGKPGFVTIGPARYLAIAGRGEPGSAVFSDRLGALYNVAFTIKMASKFRGHDYAVPKLEGLWWGDRPGAAFIDEPRENWNWKLLLRLPEFITETERAAAIAKLAKQGKPAECADVEILHLEEGLCVQVLHVGPYTEERGTIERMEAFAREKGASPHGLHHEIYLSDPRRAAPEKLRTILRQPVKMT